MTIREFTNDERFDHSSGYNYHGHGISAERMAGSDTAVIKAHTRSNADDRDAIAAKMATLTESWTITTTEPRYRWLVTYRTTHRILPIEGAPTTELQKRARAVINEALASAESDDASFDDLTGHRDALIDTLEEFL